MIIRKAMMPRESDLQTTQSALVRGKQIKSAVRKLKQKIKKIQAEGEVAPRNCHIIRYQIKRNQKIYWYYKLQGLNIGFVRPSAAYL